jgi:hypothetical protein
MSKHQEWKMVHLLYLYGRRTGRSARRVLTEDELRSAGVHCDPDSRQVLEDARVVKRIGNAYELSQPARKLLSTFTLAKGPETQADLRIDYPEAFVVMPFSQPWSGDVYAKLFEPAIADAGFKPMRGDAIVRLGDLGTNVWRSICLAGVIVADVTAPNPNVYYELGLADALGKPILAFKQAAAVLPADIGGKHFYEYDPKDLAAARLALTKALTDLAAEPDNQFFGVKALVDAGKA